MFCEKCGAQLPDTAKFCNKCGNTLRKNINTVQAPMRNFTNVSKYLKIPSLTSVKKNKGLFKILVGIILLVLLIVVAVVIFSGIKKKTSIYGTWADESHTVVFTFSEDGNLRISGANNVLGADAFQFTEEDGVLHLQTQGLVEIALDLEYEISDDTLNMSVMGHNMTLYSVDDSEVENVEEAVESWVEDALDTVQVYSLYGTWTDSYGAISFTFSEEGKLSVSGLDTLSVDAFTFTEVDDDTLQLKADTDNPIAGMVGLNMDYEISGDTMTVTIAEQSYTLIKQKVEKGREEKNTNYNNHGGFAGDVFGG